MAGYTVCNDVTVKDWQMHTMTIGPLSTNSPKQDR